MCGLSLGGYLAIELAVRHPERVSGLVISGASAEPRGLLLPPAIRGLALVMDQGSRPRVDRLNRSWFRRRFPPATSNASFSRVSPSSSSMRAAFAAYPGPTLILNGQFDVPFRLGEGGFRRAARDSRVVVIRRASHLVNLDRPSAYSAALARFTAEVTRTEGNGRRTA